MVSKQYIKNVLFALVCLLPACTDPEAHVVATVDDYPLLKSEMKYWMLLQRAEVHSYFYRQHGVVDGDDFWQQEYGGESPLEMLKERALQKALRCKVQQLLALKKGVTDQICFDSIQAEVEVVNRVRKTKIEQGEVVYGPASFTSRTYFAHVFDNMVIQLKEELLKSELKIPDNELSRLVSKYNTGENDNALFFEKQYVDNHYDTFVDSLVANARLKINNRVWTKLKADFN